MTTKLADTSVTSVNKNNQFSHRCPVFAIAWTPEGRGLVAGNAQGEFTLWDGHEFNFLTIWQGHDHAIRALTWSNSGEFLVSADGDQQVGGYDQVLHHYTVRCAAWHLFEPLILSGGKDHKVNPTRSSSCTTCGARASRS